MSQLLSFTGRAGKALLHAPQLSFFLSTAKITVGLAGIRGGKTHAGALKTILYAIQHPCHEDECHLVASPTFTMSRVPVEKIFRLLYDRALFPVSPLIKYMKGERTFLLSAVGGALTRIKVVSMHNPDVVRGIKALSCWIDEGAYISGEAWDILQGRCADTDGPIWITTTPAGYNFVHDLYDKAIEERDAGIPIQEREYRFVHWKSTDNPYVKQKGFERLGDAFDSRTYAQEVEGLFVKAAGLVYHGFSRAGNIKTYRLNKSLPIGIGQDFNVGAMASSFQQTITLPGGVKGVHVFHERLAKDSNTQDLLNYVDRFVSDNGLQKHNVTFTPDASGAARSTSGKSDYQLIKAAGYRVDSPKKNPFVKDRVNCVNSLLSPRMGPRRLYVVPDAHQHIKTFEKQQWEEGSDPPAPDKEQGLDHIADACGYRAWKLFPLRMSAGVGIKELRTRKAA